MSEETKIGAYSAICDWCEVVHESPLPDDDEGPIEIDGWVLVPWRFTFCPTCRTIDDLVL